MLKNRITRNGKKVSVIRLEPAKPVTTSDLCLEKFEGLKEYKNAMRRFNAHISNFIELSWEEKKNGIISFLEKYGFQNISFSNGEMFFKFKQQSVVTMTNHDIDAMFTGLESAFRRLEELEGELW